MNIFRNLFKKDIGSGFQFLLPKKYSTNRANKSLMADAYNKWIYICVSKNADAVASQTLRLIANTKNIKQKYKEINIKEYKHHKSLMANRKFKAVDNYVEIVEHPFLQLLEKPLKGETQYSTMYAIVTNLELFGVSYILLNKSETLGIPLSMQVLHSQYVTYTVDNITQEIQEYTYGFGIKQQKISPEDIIVIKYYSPYSDTDGFAPLQSVFDSYTLDNSFDEYQLALNKNSGNPSAIIKYNNSPLKKEDRDALEASWNKTLGGLSNSGKAKVIGGDFSIEKLGLAPKDLDFINGRRVAKETILSAFGVPIPFVDAKETNRESFKTAMLQYQMFTIEPKIKQIVDELNVKLLSIYGEDRLYLTYDDPVEARHEQIVDNAIKLLNANIISVEEARDQIFNS